MRICQDSTTLLSFYNMFENDMVQASIVVCVCVMLITKTYIHFLPYGGEIKT